MVNKIRDKIVREMKGVVYSRYYLIAKKELTVPALLDDID